MYQEVRLTDSKGFRIRCMQIARLLLSNVYIRSTVPLHSTASTIKHHLLVNNSLTQPSSLTMAQVLGVVANVLGVFGFFASSFQNPNPNVCNVRVAAALNGPDLSGADGSIQAVRIYNENQQLIGSRSGGYIGSGGFADFGVQQSNNQQAMFVQIQATNDAICIPYATTTFVDGAKYGWIGDWGAFCGLNWYYGNVAVSLFSHHISNSTFLSAC